MIKQPLSKSYSKVIMVQLLLMACFGLTRCFRKTFWTSQQGMYGISLLKGIDMGYNKISKTLHAPWNTLKANQQQADK